MQACDLNKFGYKTSNVGRSIKRGGGIAIIYNNAIKCELISNSITESFEFGKWKVNSSGNSLTIIDIYHPPYSSIKQITSAAFLDAWGDFLAENIDDCNNCIIAGDIKPELRRTKSETVSSSILEMKGDSRKIFDLVSNLTGSHSENPLPESDSDNDLADRFADFFLNKIIKIRNELDGKPMYVPTQPSKLITPLAKFKTIMPEHVKKTVMKMKTKSCELDPLPTNILKKCIDEISPIIAQITNISMQTGSCAAEWKEAVVKPLLKKQGLNLELKNYRPVSTLSFLSKVVEKIVLVQYQQHVDMHDLLPDYQSAYRKDYSCETALLKLCNDALWRMEKQEITNLCVIDLSASFDTVDHNVLLTVLEEKFGIKSEVLDWFDSYLRPRYLKVKIKNEYSKPQPLHFLVPQGSVAGPQLYSAYASTMAEVVEDSNIGIYGFADDHALHNGFNAEDRSKENDTGAIP